MVEQADTWDLKSQAHCERPGSTPGGGIFADIKNYNIKIERRKNGIN